MYNLSKELNRTIVLKGQWKNTLSVFESSFEIMQDLKVLIIEKNNSPSILKRYYPCTKLEAAGQKNQSLQSLQKNLISKKTFSAILSMPILVSGRI